MRARRATPRPARRSLEWCWPACLALWVAACAPAEDARETGAGEGPAGGVAGEAPQTPEGAEPAPAAVVESAGPDPAGSGWRPASAPDTTTRVGRVLLANRCAAAVVVLASAGAEEVTLDTVPGGDSAVVEIRVRADTVVLRAVEPGGTVERARRTVGLLPDSTVRWEIR